MDENIESVHWAAIDSSAVIPLRAEAEFRLPPIASRPVTRPIEFQRTYALAKRLLDLGGAMVLAAAFSPLLLVVSLWASKDGGDVLFSHIRIGKNGKAFKVYKFRTMVPNSDRVLRDLLCSNPELKAEWLRDHKLKDDPRVTTIGKFLRKTSLDELPQLWNVVKGEMSLVGPRPIVRAELHKYGRTSRYYLAVKPGLTGIWQISGRNDTDYYRRVAMDRHYVRIASLSLDLVVLLKTVDVVLRRRGAY